eukprot:scaffold1839_cov382-Prasinococcus_capsulatus_cf.AAC.17
MGDGLSSCRVAYLQIADAHVRRPLVHLTGELAVGDVELRKHVAGGQRHLRQCCRVPRRQNNAAVPRFVLDSVNHLRQLVHALVGVVRVHVFILGSKVAPLEAIDRAQVAHLPLYKTNAVEVLTGAIPVPDADALLGQLPSVGGAPHEPQKLLHHPAPKDALGCEYRKTPPKIETHLLAEQGVRASAGSVHTLLAESKDLLDHVQVLILFVPLLCSQWKAGKVVPGGKRRGLQLVAIARGVLFLLVRRGWLWLADVGCKAVVYRGFGITVHARGAPQLENVRVDLGQEGIALEVTVHLRQMHSLGRRQCASHISTSARQISMRDEAVPGREGNPWPPCISGHHQLQRRFRLCRHTPRCRAETVLRLATVRTRSESGRNFSGIDSQLQGQSKTHYGHQQTDVPCCAWHTKYGGTYVLRPITTAFRAFFWRVWEVTWKAPGELPIQSDAQLLACRNHDVEGALHCGVRHPSYTALADFVGSGVTCPLLPFLRTRPSAPAHTPSGYTCTLRENLASPPDTGPPRRRRRGSRGRSRPCQRCLARVERGDVPRGAARRPTVRCGAAWIDGAVAARGRAANLRGEGNERRSGISPPTPPPAVVGLPPRLGVVQAAAARFPPGAQRLLFVAADDAAREDV